MSRIRSSANRSPGWRLVLALVPLLLPAVATAQDADHLLISEVVVQTREPAEDWGSPFIEITNPTAAAVDLSDVYLTTAHDATLGRLYWNVVGGENAGGGASGNVHGRFPYGMILAPGGSLVISLNGSNHFEDAYGFLPDIEFFEDGAAPDQVPEMVEAVAGSIGAGLGSSGGNVPALSTGSDSIILYRWDGANDLVQDLDYFFYGTDSRVRADKTGVTVGAGTYLADTPVASQISAGTAATYRSAHARIGSEETGETQTGGNGVTDHDETSEDLASSWEITVNSQDPAGPPASWHPPAPIVLDADNGNPREGSPVPVQARFTSYDELATVTVSYRFDGGDWTELPAESSADDIYVAVIPAQPVDTVVDWYLVAVTVAGGQATWPVRGANGPASYTVLAGAGDGAAKLLITEVNAGPNIFPSYLGMHQIAPEFIEINNPNAYPVDMTDYYLTDAINYVGTTQVYWNITAGNPTQQTVGGGNYNDFTARFPEGYTLEPGQTIVISMASSGWFEQVYRQLPDLEMYEDEMSVAGVPQMRPVFINPDTDPPGDSIFTPGREAGGSEQLPRGIPEMEEHYGEPLILYYWDPEDDVVVDIDIFMWGDSKDGQYSVGFDKTGEEGYNPDTPIADQDWFYPVDETGDVTYTRVDADEAGQAALGSNGVDGRDETGELWNETFILAYPTPGVFLAGLEPSQDVALTVPARTFLPGLGETFDIEMITSENSETKLRILDLEGRLVITLWDSRFDGQVSGVPEFPTVVSWDGRDATFEQVRAGMYVVHLQAVDRITGEQLVKTAPVVVATRLK